MIRILALGLFRAELRTRMPFKYGIATMTELPHVFLRATVEVDGKAQDGIAADNLPPKWFTKDPARDPASEIDEMLHVIRQAMRLASAASAPSVFALWRELYARQSAWGTGEKLPPLLTNFGTSLVERAVLDALARSRRAPLHRLVGEEAVGIDLGAIHAGLAGSRALDWLPGAPLAKVIARHTVGLSDPLTSADIEPGGEIHDGLPQTLEDCIRRYGLRHFKVKIDGRREADMDRLERLAALLAQHAPADHAFSLDGNESYYSIAAFRDFWRELVARPRLAAFARRILFVEQPFHRDIALSEEFGTLQEGWPDRPPIIIDESDAELGSLQSALRIGYAGTSHKNCKGVIKGIANACLLSQLGRAHPRAGFMMSGEDLGNIGPVALLQDLAVQAMMGVTSVERNGHHYFAGLSFWPADWQAAILDSHPDLYSRSPLGWPTLDLTQGEVSLGSVNAAPFGVAFLPDLSALACVAES